MLSGHISPPSTPGSRSSRLKVLLIIEQCNPEWSSVPLEGFHYFDQISRLADTTLVTHSRNQKALATFSNGRRVVYVDESRRLQQYYRAVLRLTSRGRINWPLLHALSYPVYAEFNHKVHRRFRRAVEDGSFDIVHGFTPINPRYPYQIVEACHKTPFVLGPVNGGLPYPAGFEGIADRESGRFNVLRRVARWIPGYTKTYQRADKVLAGSRATLGLLQRTFALPNHRLELFHENGVSSEFFGSRRAAAAQSAVHLLFVGRLVPYKCADVVIEALHRLVGQASRQIGLTIVGEGPERTHLERLTAKLGLNERVSFAGWVPQRDTVRFYRQADVFCFPSVREFGGAVVLEAMACGLPAIVADYGGVAEYVTEDAGFKLPLTSRDQLLADLADRIRRLVENEPLRLAMSAAAVDRARQFEWQRKGTELLRLYHQVIEEKHTRVRGQ
jgi:glycosyltransferase involved in cell wall biosynthesis